jgi:translation elongation factor EF-Ts
MAMSRAANPKQYNRDPGADDKAKQKEAEERRKDAEFADKYLKKSGGKIKAMKKGGKCACDGIAQRGKTKARRRA